MSGLEEVRELAVRISERITFLIEGTATAKAQDEIMPRVVNNRIVNVARVEWSE